MRFESEQDFEAFYRTLASPDDQLRELAEWRRFQIKIVSKFIDQIRLVADEQYSDVDHFLLELLQNADDNEYLPEVTPRVAIELSSGQLILDNNEIGFSADNLYAITYAAASTKIRRKAAATYIGEKGIGFKSVFAVADQVEIHSGPYHFQLKNGEFIVPYPVPIENVAGTRIKLQFKKGHDDLARFLSQRLEQIGTGPHEFTMFLRKLRELAIHDRIAGREHLIRSGPDVQSGFWRIECAGIAKRYVRHAYPRDIPGNVVETRFRDLKEDLPRQIDLAVPVPEPSGTLVADEGRLFCFLPTHIRTGCPVRIQADATTPTHRENIQNFGTSPWNKSLFDGLASDLINFYRKLTSLDEFKLDLPTCWPVGIEQRDIRNGDLKELLSRVEKDLGNHPLVLDRHGTFRRAAEVRLLPSRFAVWLADDACESAVSTHADAAITFVDTTWERRHRGALVAIGVRELSSDEFLAALACDFASRTVDEDEQPKRSFLEDVMVLADAMPQHVAKFKQFPIFPVRVGERQTWAALSGDAFWVQSDSAKVAVPGNTPIVDPAFTYSPGGSTTRTTEGERVRQFNTRFRNFLSQTLGVPHHDELQLLRRTVVKDLKVASGDLADITFRRKVNHAWARLFVRAWKRQRRIINELGQKAFDEFIGELKKCRIPARDGARSAWQMVEVSAGFLGKPFNSEGTLDKIYAGTGAPFIQLDLLEEKKPNAKKTKGKPAGVDWPEWRNFLESIGVHAGPFFVHVELGSPECLGSYQSIGARHATFGSLKVAVDTAVGLHDEFSHGGASAYSIHSNSHAPSRTVGLDYYSLAALRHDRGHQFIGRLISAVWHGIKRFSTEIRFMWGAKYTTRYATTDYIALFDQLHALLKLDTTLGLQPCSMCFSDSLVNQQVLGRIAPLVQVGEGGYAPGMLRALGVRGDAGIDDLLRLVEQWVAESQLGERTAAEFASLLEVICRYLEQHPGEAAQIEYRIQLFNPLSREMQAVSDWISGEAARSFEGALVGRLRDLLGRGAARDAAALAALLFELGDIRNEAEAFFRALVDLGRRLSVESGTGALRVFEAKLSEDGILVDGEAIHCRQDLPMIWDLNPSPTEFGLPLIADLPAEQHQFVSIALQALGWSCASSARLEPVDREPLGKLDMATARLVVLAVQDVTKRVSRSRPDIGARLRSIGLLDSPTTVQDGIRVAENLTLSVENGTVTMTVGVPYWHHEGRLYVDADYPLDRALPEFIDHETDATCSGFFDLVWEQAKSRARCEPGEDVEPRSKTSSQSRTGEGSDEGDDHGDKGTGDSSNGSEGTDVRGGTDSERGEGSGSESGKDVKDTDGPRRRLCSYVTLAGDKVGGKDDGESSKNDETKAVEEAGRARMFAYFESHGAQVVSREKDNVGYDFEVSFAGRTLFIELKSSRDRWQGWEHALTRNEFVQAYAKGEDYFLCAVDRALSDDWKIYFIANPAGLVDQYVFDDPWKRVAIDMNALFEQMKHDAAVEEEV